MMSNEDVVNHNERKEILSELKEIKKFYQKRKLKYKLYMFKSIGYNIKFGFNKITKDIKYFQKIINNTKYYSEISTKQLKLQLKNKCVDNKKNDDNI